jgi:hypothetical protein
VTGGSAVAAEPETSKLRAPPGEATTTVKSGMLVIKRSKAQDDDHGKNTKLTVRYWWSSHFKKEKEDWRKASVQDAGAAWIITFRDQPPPKGDGEIEYTFTYELNAADREKIEGIFWSASAEIIAATRAELNATRHEKRRFSSAALKDEINALSARLARYDHYQTAKGEPLSDHLLKQLGLEKRGSEWVAGEALKEQLLLFSGQITKFDLRNEIKYYNADRVKLKKIEREQGESATTKLCRDTALSIAPKLTARVSASELKHAVLIVSRCSASLAAALNKAQSANPTDSRAAAIKTAVKALQELTLTAASVNLETSTSIQQFVEKIRVFYTSSAHALKNENENRADIDARVDARGLLLSSKLLQIAASELDKDKYTRDLLDDITLRVDHYTTSVKNQDSIEVDEKRRWFDVSVGVAYVPGLDDVIVPTLVSVCPLAKFGCLRNGRKFWDSGWNALSSVSFDIGMRSTTVGNVDPRNTG